MKDTTNSWEQALTKLALFLLEQVDILISKNQMLHEIVYYV